MNQSLGLFPDQICKTNELKMPSNAIGVMSPCAGRPHGLMVKGRSIMSPDMAKMQELTQVTSLIIKISEFSSNNIDGK